MGDFSGKFIVLDGPDGCGKSTQTKLLAEWIQKQGTTCVSFRDPGSTDIGEKIREILLNPEHIRMDTQTELLLYMAARAQLWSECVKPTLEKGDCVLMDRWVSSTCAYQGYAGGFGIEKVIDVAEHCLERLWPDITVILDVDLATARQRMNRELDRMENKGVEYHKKVRAGFLRLAEMRKDIFIVDAGRDIQTIHREITELIEKV